jgi:hypothetical protein
MKADIARIAESLPPATTGLQSNSDATRSGPPPGYGNPGLPVRPDRTLVRLRDRARAAWGAGFSLQRFHDALLSLGSPPLGLMPAALEPSR